MRRAALTPGIVRGLADVVTFAECVAQERRMENSDARAEGAEPVHDGTELAELEAATEYLTRLCHWYGLHRSKP